MHEVDSAALLSHFPRKMGNPEKIEEIQLQRGERTRRSVYELPGYSAQNDEDEEKCWGSGSSS